MSSATGQVDLGARLDEDRPMKRINHRMTRAEYRRAIDALGLSQVDAGDFLEVTERTSRRYAAGGPIPGPVRILLRYMVRRKLKPVQVKPEGS
jgi:hypothetical protein